MPAIGRPGISSRRGRNFGDEPRSPPTEFCRALRVDLYEDGRSRVEKPRHVTLLEEAMVHAPGSPGLSPRWTSSAKSGVGVALSPTSHVWFTISHGILNEVYYPRVDQACTRDFGLIVTNGADFFSEE